MSGNDLAIAAAERSSPQHEDLTRALEALVRFQNTPNAEDIDTAIEYARSCATDTSSEAEDQLMALTVLGASLHVRYQQPSSEGGGDTSDIDAAVEAVQEAVKQLVVKLPTLRADTKDEAFIYFENFEQALLFRQCLATTATEKEAQMNDSIQSTSHIVSLTEMHEDGEMLRFHSYALKTMSVLNSLGYEETKNDEYLDRAIDTAQRAIAIASSDVRANLLDRLANLLEERVQRTRSITDLDSLIQVCQELVDGGYVKDRLGHFQCLHDLSSALANRSVLTDNPLDLARAIAYGQTSVKEVSAMDRSEDAPTKAAEVALQGLRIKVKAYFKLTGKMAELDEDILDELGVLGMIEIGDDKDSSLGELRKLAGAFHSLYETSQRVAYIEYAILLTLRVIEEMGPSSEGWGLFEDDYRSRCRLWSDQTGRMPDWEMSVMNFGSNERTWIPPEWVGKLSLKTPWYLSIGKID